MEPGTKMAFPGTDRANVVAWMPPAPPPPSWRLWGVAPLPNVPHVYGGGGQAAVANFTAEHATSNGELAFQAAAHSTAPETAGKLRLQLPTGDELRVSPRQGQGGRVRQPAPPCAREHLFQKVLTPSDVGNLNRLVVPKQHAEKHLFVKRNPLMAAGMGVLLDVKDGEGKTWRFRYSYCRSSRIYILTKGWRRFVREKGLQAGDTVAFSRSAIGPFKQMHIHYWKKQEDTAAEAIAVESPAVVMLFGVDIARRGGSPELRST